MWHQNFSYNELLRIEAQPNLISRLITLTMSSRVLSRCLVFLPRESCFPRVANPRPWEREANPRIKAQLRILDIKKAECGKNHPGTIITLEKLAHLYRDVGRLQVGQRQLSRTLCPTTEDTNPGPIVSSKCITYT